jgi:uncharacterized membrane-anchored protein YjiN (DUF445 family)
MPLTNIPTGTVPISGTCKNNNTSIKDVVSPEDGKRLRLLLSCIDYVSGNSLIDEFIEVIFKEADDKEFTYIKDVIRQKVDVEIENICDDCNENFSWYLIINR